MVDKVTDFESPAVFQLIFSDSKVLGCYLGDFKASYAENPTPPCVRRLVLPN